ncbi:hypothetical protein R1sor_007156 [Riccia sorocarpa]|uniref:Uncharacterized protein n=1 Tax=Riccia sorocarpa TaxID=122646 RepID=A0ABD3HTA5_9MARC
MTLFPKAGSGTQAATALQAAEGCEIWNHEARVEASASPDLENMQVKEAKFTVVDLRGRPADKTKTGTWKAAVYLYALNAGDFQAMISITVSLIPILVGVAHLEISEAAQAGNNFAGTCLLLTVVGAFVADSFIGAYWTIVGGSAIFAAGLGLLTFTVSYSGIQPEGCIPIPPTVCEKAGPKYLGPLYLALYTVAVGVGAVRANLVSLGADQFDETSAKEKKQSVHFFVWFYFFTNIGLLTAFTISVYLQDKVSPGWGFGFNLMLFSVCSLIFLLGTPKFRHRVPAGSFITRVFQVLVASYRKRKINLPTDPKLLYNAPLPGSRKLDHSRKLRWLDRAAVLEKESSSGDIHGPWRLCSISQVEETKRIIQVIPVWATTAAVSLVFSQLQTYTITQGSTLDRKLSDNFELPTNSLFSALVIIAMITVPIYDRVLVPFARRFTKHPYGLSTLQRLGTAIVFAMLMMITSALVERKRLTYVRDLGLENRPLGSFILPMKMWWLLPQFFLAAQLELLLFVSSYEFYYYEASDQTRSISSSFTYSASAMGYYLTTVLTNIVNTATKGESRGAWLKGQLNNGGLEKFYWLLAIVLAVDFVIFLGVAYWYEYKFDWYHVKSPQDEQQLMDGYETGNDSDVFSLASSQLGGHKTHFHRDQELGVVK